MSKILGLVCARTNSKRLKMKNYLTYKDKTFIENAYDILVRSQCSDVYIIADKDTPYDKDDRVIIRPDLLAKDETSLQNVLKWAVVKFGKVKYDYVVNMMPTNPLITVHDVVHAFNLINKYNMNIVRSYNKKGDENGLIVVRTKYLTKRFIDTYSGAIQADGNEIHTKEEYEELINA